MPSYAYSQFLWPSFVSTALIAFLAWYAWRHRSIRAAVPFFVACLFAVAWSLGSMLETAAADVGTKVFWLKFVTIWQLPLVTAATCFVLEYAGLGRLITRRLLILLSIPPLLAAGLILTGGLHDLAWSSFSMVGNTLQPTLGRGLSVTLLYSYLLSAFNIAALVWLAIRSPRHRWPVALLVVGQVAARALFEFGAMEWRLPAQWDPDPFVLGAVFGLYAIALFRFHLLDPVPMAREAAIAQMRDAMLVVDVEGRIIDLNPSAERALGTAKASVRGHGVSDVLPIADVPGAADGEPGAQVELAMGNGVDTRHYRLDTTPLKDQGGFELGRLLLLHDITEQKRAQARALEQESVLATLRERERLARELHDGVGQVLGYVSMQAQTARKQLQDSNDKEADALLARLTEVAQHAHVDVRESILALKAASSQAWSFLPALARYAQDFQAQYDIRAELTVMGDVDEDSIDPGAAVQLLRVIQEALTNARRHGAARSVRIAVGREDGRVSITVSDDGRGFDPADTDGGTGQHYGLVFMRERMAQIDGRVEVSSRPGAGTSVRLEVPARTEGDAGT